MTSTQEYLSGVGLETRAVSQPEKVEDVEFDPAVIEQFDLTDKAQFTAASRALFAVHMKPKNPKWNSEIHTAITAWLRARKTKVTTDGFVTEHIKTTGAQRDMAQMLATAGVVSQAQLAQILRKEQMLVQSGIETLDELEALLKEQA